MRRRNDKLPSNTLIVSSSRSSFSLSLRLSFLSDLCVDSVRECEPDPLHSGRDAYSSSRKRAASPLLNSSDMLRATDMKSKWCVEEKGRKKRKNHIIHESHDTERVKKNQKNSLVLCNRAIRDYKLDRIII